MPKTIDLTQNQLEFMPPRNREEKFEGLLKLLPDGEDALIAYARDRLLEFDQAIVQSQEPDRQAVAELVEAAAIKMQGGNPESMAHRYHNGSQERLRQALTKDDGSVPAWGFPGRFIVDACGCLVLVETGGMFDAAYSWNFGAEAVDYERPFMWDTGFSSIYGKTHNAGLRFDQWAIAEIERAFRTDWNGRPKKNPKLVSIAKAYRREKAQKDPARAEGGWIWKRLQQPRLVEGNEVVHPKHGRGTIIRAWSTPARGHQALVEFAKGRRTLAQSNLNKVA